MRLNFLSYASGLGVVASALLLPAPSQAQGFCYMVDADGAVTNLNSLCQGSGTPNLSEPQADPVGAGEVQQSPSPNVRSFTIIGPSSIPGTGQAPSTLDPTTPQPTGVDAGLGSTTPQPVPSSGVAPTGSQIVPTPGVAPTAPQLVPSSRVAPVGPQIVPSPRVAPAVPQQPTEPDAGLVPADSAVGVDGAGNNTGVATPAAGIAVPAIVVPGIPVPRIGPP